MSPPGYPSAWLHPCRARFRFTRQSHCSAHVLRRLPPPPLAALLQFLLPGGFDFRLPSRRHVRRRDVSDGNVKPYGIVVLNVIPDEPPCVVRRQRRAGPDAFTFNRLVPALDLAV